MKTNGGAALIKALELEGVDVMFGLPGGAILTPHVGEMAALTGLEPEDIEARREEVAVDHAARLRAVLLIKGTTTVIASPDGELAGVFIQGFWPRLSVMESGALSSRNGRA